MTVIPQAVRKAFLGLVRPVVQALIRARVHPNTITTIGCLVVLGSAWAFGTGQIRLGGALLLLSGVFDILDGQVARDGKLASDFGAFYDSLLDRVGESALFGGIALYFVGGGVPPVQVPLAVGVSLAALSASLLVSYARARAEGLGIECKVGIAQRAERFLVLGAPSLLVGPGREGRVLFWIVVVLALATGVTVIQRVHHVYRATRRPGAATAVRRDTLPGRT
ncbi:MAG: CDP-alcohol phosphatidyltransferase family protein, partial [Gemmatimonadales bacterium]